VGSKVELAPGKWLLRIYAGREGGRYVQKNRVFRGTKRQAERELRRFQVEVDQRRGPKATAAGIVEGLLYRNLRTSGDDCLPARGKPLADSTIRRLDKTCGPPSTGA
jgi:hypothetical protein